MKYAHSRLTVILCVLLLADISVFNDAGDNLGHKTFTWTTVYDLKFRT